jgi:hypothetical protein
LTPKVELASSCIQQDTVENTDMAKAFLSHEVEVSSAITLKAEVSRNPQL